jgi:hypothetical protein
LLFGLSFGDSRLPLFDSFFFLSDLFWCRNRRVDSDCLLWVSLDHDLLHIQLGAVLEMKPKLTIAHWLVRNKPVLSVVLIIRVLDILLGLFLSEAESEVVLQHD